MKNFTFLILSILVLSGCSSSPIADTTAETAIEEDLPKAVPRQKVQEKMIIQSSTNSKPQPAPPSEKRSCETPLGMIPDGGKKTGFLNSEVGPNEICISDTISCKDGEWKGTAIHEKCVKRQK